MRQLAARVLVAVVTCGGAAGRLAADPPPGGPVPGAPAAVDAAAGVEAFLHEWGKAEGKEFDGTTKYPKRVRRSADGMVMVLIPGGKFLMGAVPGTPAYADQHPRHEVTLTKAYYLDEHEVTIGMWKAYATAQSKSTPTLEKEVTDAHPMHNVSWDDVQGYLAWARVSLPTEAQWERAARGGHDDFVYPWGAKHDAKRGNFEAWSGDDFGLIQVEDPDGFIGPAPVKSFAANDFGLYDMCGNVLEWCADWFHYQYYASSPKTDPLGPATGSLRVVRGGAWTGGFGTDSALARAGSYPGRNPESGFRCVRALP